MPSSKRKYLVVYKDDGYELFESLEELKDYFKTLARNKTLYRHEKLFLSTFHSEYQVFSLKEEKTKDMYLLAEAETKDPALEFERAKMASAKLNNYVDAYFKLPEHERRVLQNKIAEIEGKK